MQKNCPKKGVIFEKNSTINCVYPIRHKIRMSTSLNKVFNLIFGIVYFVVLIFNIHGRKMQFSESSENSESEKSIFGHFNVIFLNV